jgi:hypothetical protein
MYRLQQRLLAFVCMGFVSKQVGPISIRQHAKDTTHTDVDIPGAVPVPVPVVGDNTVPM